MYLKSIIKYISLCICVALLSFRADAQRFSYVYIQGDKQTPFYVKLEDAMQPRYGKNHCIVPQLAPGPLHIEILFQQNIFPPQKFTIQVPENGYRGFILTKRSGNFALYDIQQQFYLPANNSADDDHAPVYNTATNYVAAGATAPVTDAPPIPKKAPVKKTSIKRNVSSSKSQDNSQPQFIDNLELNNEKTVQPITQTQDTPAEVIENGADNNISARNKRGIINSDCPAPIDSKEFDNMLNKLQKHTDSYRLKYLLSKLGNCYSTSQIRLLTKELNNDPERYQFLKQVYPRVTDQSNFPLLESLLSTQEWKSYFLLIMP
ncbi:MAG: DUF4476 domain-containing protein [Bacteroidetes bacterium]|nr:DUF4476 domain-containing protein [Bacteroidota bacterium]